MRSMQRFFKDFTAIDLFTRSLDYHQDQTRCAHCLKNDQFISHGIIYKQRSITVREPVGKRIFCSNRYGRSGCGRTCQLVICAEIPRFRCGTAVLFVFISLLLDNLTVNESYYRATGQFDSRNAWRWLNKLMQQLGRYRCVLKSRTNIRVTQFKSKARRLQLLLPTLAQMVCQPCDDLCASWQLTHQRAFI